MNRLTKRTKNGIAYMAIADTLPKSEQEIEGSKPILEGLYAMFQKLADFEDREETTNFSIVENESAFIMDETIKCEKCEGEFIVKDGTFNYCPRCGRRVV